MTRFNIYAAIGHRTHKPTIKKDNTMTTQNTDIRIDGMTCGGCVKSVENALGQVDGVLKVAVSLEDKKATVSFDDSKTNEAMLKEAIEDAGYDVV